MRAAPLQTTFEAMPDATWRSALGNRAGVLRPKWVYVGVAAVLAAVIIPAVITGVARGIFPLLSLLIHLFLFGGMALRYAFNSTHNAKIDEGRLEVDAADGGGNLRLDGIDGKSRVIVKREELRQAFVTNTDDGRTLVRLERKGRFKPPIFVRVAEDQDGRALLRALGMDAEHVIAEMRVASSLLAMSVWRQLLLTLGPMLLMAGIFFGLAMTFGPTVVPLTSLAMVAFIGYVLTVAMAPTKVRIGTDGVFTSWLGRKRFIPFSMVEYATVYDEIIGTKRQHGVRLSLRDASMVVRLPTGQTDIARSDAHSLLGRIEEARNARGAAATTHVTHVKDSLVRGHRSIEEWIVELKRIGAGVFDHRSAAIPIEALLTIVEDTRALPFERASAAIAAMSSNPEPDEATLRRVRIAGETTASPKLRVALTTIAEKKENVQELTEALDELDETNKEGKQCVKKLEPGAERESTSQYGKGT